MLKGIKMLVVSFYAVWLQAVEPNLSRPIKILLAGLSKESYSRHKNRVDAILRPPRYHLQSKDTLSLEVLAIASTLASGLLMLEYTLVIFWP